MPYLYIMKQLLLFSGVGFLLYTFFAKKNFVKSSNFNFESFDLDWKRKKIFVFLSVANPTGQTLNINAVSGNLLINGTILASVESFDKTIIQPTAKSTIKLQLIPSALGLLTQLKNVIQLIKEKKKKTKLNAKFIGAVNMEGISIPVDLELMN